MSYTKLFNSIVTSTIWTEDDKTRIVWITILAIADKNGEVQASIPGLARLAAVSVDACETAINKFLSPDKYSRTSDDEGRRLEKIEGGWAILNHSKYRLMASKEDSKSAGAERQKRYLERKNRNNHKMSQDDVSPSQSVTMPSQNALNDVGMTDDWDIAEAEAEAEVKSTPTGGVGGELKSKSDLLPTSPQAIRISELFHRKPSTKWSSKEIRSFKAIPKESLEHIGLVCRYTEAERLKGSDGRHRRDLLTFLNNFTGELDRARAKPATNGKSKATSASQYGI